ncbi:MAG: FxsA family protein [Planctomycetota bacterium]|nr:FxsA family protein [Planctomycetota bacterium]
MLSRLFLLLALVPLAELWLLMELAQQTSWLTTIVVVLSTGVIGISLVRWQGIKTLKDIQRQLAAGESPSQTIVSAVLILVAGALLLTPGLLTDTVGFLLLIPSFRFATAAYLQRRFMTSISTKFRSSVWVQSGSFGSGFADDAQSNASERPSVRVVEPDPPRIEE